jgi:hypothetical protein
MIEHQDRGPTPQRGRGVIVAGAVAFLALGLGLVPQAHPQSQPKVKIAFVGDSTSDGIWGGMTSLGVHNACVKTGFELGRYAKNSTGLTRPERFDWVAETRRIGDSVRPQLFVMSLGLNDRQSVVEKGQITMDNSEAYPAKYKERITGVLAGAAASKASLLWIGLPAMRSPAADKDAREKNNLFIQAIAEFGVANIKFVKPWRLGSGDDDKFQSYAPDQNGRMVQIRASDGEHFTPAGDLLVATYLLPQILASLAEDGTRICDQGTGQTQ